MINGKQLIVIWGIGTIFATIGLRTYNPYYMLLGIFCILLPYLSYHSDPLVDALEAGIPVEINGIRYEPMEKQNE